MRFGQVTNRRVALPLDEYERIYNRTNAVMAAKKNRNDKAWNIVYNGLIDEAKRRISG